jgi:D-glycero-D-manno-heptose 1,7-bisphosphate phosphatase
MTATVSKGTHRALFVDRDGVINREKDYVWQPEEFEFLPGVFAALREAADKGYLILIITNQAGIARGYYSEEDYHRLTEWMLHKFRDEGVEVTAVYFDPFHPEGIGKYRKESLRRKPNPGMIFEAARDHGISLQQSVLVGDKLTDTEAGRRAGVGRLFLVRTGHPFAEEEVPEGVEVAEDLREVVKRLEKVE